MQRNKIDYDKDLDNHKHPILPASSRISFQEDALYEQNLSFKRSSELMERLHIPES